MNSPNKIALAYASVKTVVYHGSKEIARAISNNVARQIARALNKAQAGH